MGPVAVIHTTQYGVGKGLPEQRLEGGSQSHEGKSIAGTAELCPTQVRAVCPRRLESLGGSEPEHKWRGLVMRALQTVRTSLHL